MSNSAQKYRSLNFDILRSFAAIWVVFHHWVSHDGFQKKILYSYSIPDFLANSSFLKLGYMGVDLFFILSGIVIGQSCLNNSWHRFSFSRFKRLYPSYLIATILALLLIPITYKESTFFDFTYFWSIFGVQWFFGFPTSIGPAWTLFYEIRFYIAIALFIYFFGNVSRDRLLKFATFWCFLLLLAPSLNLPWFNFLVIGEYGPYFVLGIFLGQFSDSATLNKYFGAFILALILACIRLSARASGILPMGQSILFSIGLLAAIILITLTPFYLNRRYSVNHHTHVLITAFAILTYPLYLLHESVGMPFIGFLTLNGFDFVLASMISFLFLVFICWVIAKYCDPFFQLLFSKFNFKQII